MSTSTGTRTDHALQISVQAELEWTPEIEAAGIGVAVTNGVVTLSGDVNDYSELLAANRAATRVKGVSTVVNDLTLPPMAGSPVNEADLAREVAHALRWATAVPETVKAEVKGHHVTLTGAVEWHFQRVAAHRAVQYLPGIHALQDDVTLTPRASSNDAEERVKQALIRNAQLEASNISIKITDNKATLTGHVQSLAEKHKAGMATWTSPNVAEVDNQLEVRPN